MGVYEQYSSLAKYYDQVYQWKDYRREAAKIRKLIREHKVSKGNDLLDVGCGTGKHVQCLCGNFRCVGVDASERMLEVARKNAPGVEYIRSGMTDLKLGRQFDVVLCLFSSIGYLTTRNELRKAIDNFSAHMKTGAVLIVEPWFEKSEWTKGSVHMRNLDQKSLKIARVGYSTAEGDFSIADERYVIAEKDKGIAHVVDRQKMRFFEPDWTFKTMHEAGLSPRFADLHLMPGRRLLVATKP